LPHGRFRKDMIDQVGGRLDHPPRPATRADKIAGSDFEQPKAGPKGVGQDARSNPLRLQLNATRACPGLDPGCSWRQPSHLTRRNPCSSSPHCR
jgi:hypothetical protein